MNRPSRLAKYIVARGWLHVILFSAVCVFLFPFVWMIATSLKTDEEVATEQILPAMPSFQPQSPYVRPAAAIARPEAVTDARWEIILPRLRDLAKAKLAAATQPVGADAVDASTYHSAATDTLVARLAAKINIDLWPGDVEKIYAEFEKLLTPEAIKDALDDRLATFELRGLLVRTLDTHIHQISKGDSIAASWKVESGDATLETKDSAALVRYRFPSANDQPIVLRYDFDFPADPKELHKLILAIKPDDSWHQLSITLDLGGTRWIPTRENYLGTTRATSVFFQPPTFDDTTARKRIWTSLTNIGKSPENSLNPRHAALRVILTPSSTSAAIYGKVARNYIRVFDSVPFWQYVGNSIWLVALVTIGTLFSASFVAYAFARLHWPGRSVAFGILLATMMLPGQVTMIPSFMIWRQLGWYNTLCPMWVPAWFGGAFFIFLMVQNMKTIPRELEEAARIDGLNALRTWWHIILPQTKPTLAAIAIMTFMGAWNEFMGPLIYLRDQSKFPLSLGLFGIRLENMTDWSLLMAANVLMTAPVVIIFFLFQRYFIQGMTMSGMKG